LVTLSLMGAVGKNAGKQTSDPQAVQEPPAGNCAACHGDKAVLPPGHADTREMMIAECAQCHTRTDKNLWTKITLSHIHALHAIGCGDCHKNPAQPAPLSTGECLTCHGTFETVAALTETLHPDPHHSPHYGISVDCDLCHRSHLKSENFCAQCHDWVLVVP
jgi:hypothetical protein